MRKFIIALAFSASMFSTTAFAQDWSGFYVGVHGGYGTGDWSGRTIYEPTPPCPAGPGCGTFHGDSGSIDVDGAIGGIQAGFNLQSGNIVYGIEADISAADLDGSRTFVTDQTNNVLWAIDGDLKGFGSLRGRLGFTSGPVLFYGTGGIAWARSSLSLSVTQNPTNDLTAVGKTSDTETG